jgi:UDP-2,3-diacylglucosamine hydrolase
MTAIGILPDIKLTPNKKVYFASDFHLGIPTDAISLQREQLICNWLDIIAKDAQHVFLLGDIFDAWIEYKHAVPKGFIRFLGKLAHLVDSGIKVTVFTGNHDLWMYGYFEKELNIPVLKKPMRLAINGKQYLLAHGDGLGPGDNKYKALKYILNHPISQWLYKWLHPDLGIPLASYFSRKGLDKKKEEVKFLGDKEYFIQFCLQQLQLQHTDYFICGHRHYMLVHALSKQSTYINLGDWLTYNSYAVAEADGCSLTQYSNK